MRAAGKEYLARTPFAFTIGIPVEIDTPCMKLHDLIAHDGRMMGWMVF